MPKHLKGRASIFRGKEHGTRIVGIITERGATAFEMSRARLSALFANVMGEKPTHVSDADVIEYLTRGEEPTRRYLEGMKRRA